MHRIAAPLVLGLFAFSAQSMIGTDYILRTHGDVATGVDDQFRFVIPDAGPPTILDVSCFPECDIYVAIDRQVSRDVFDDHGSAGGVEDQIYTFSRSQGGVWYVLVTSPQGLEARHNTYVTVQKDGYVDGETDSTTHRMLGIDVNLTAANFEVPRLLLPGRIVRFGDELAVTPNSMTVYFFNESVPEATVKILDACIPLFGEKLWFFGMAGTNVELTAMATQVSTGHIVEWTNESGNPAVAYTNTHAFDCIP